jgi:hypothetical protein
MSVRTRLTYYSDEAMRWTIWGLMPGRDKGTVHPRIGHEDAEGE